MNKQTIGISKFEYSGHIGSQELSDGPTVMEQGGLLDLLSEWDCEIVDNYTPRLTEKEEKAYGARHRMGLASSHLAENVGKQIKEGIFPLGLLANCCGLMGMLAGHQKAGDSWSPLRVGLIWIDAHGDFNTPETSLSGMTGGMPVAISTGLCLHHIRRTCGLDPPLPMSYVTMVGVRDTDPWEQNLIDTYGISQITTDEVKRLSPVIDLEMDRLSRLTDIIYVHVDLDVLDPPDIPGAGLPVVDGPTADELGESLELIFENPQAAGFGMASYPYRRDPERKGLKSVYRLVEGVVKGINNREN